MKLKARVRFAIKNKLCVSRHQDASEYVVSIPDVDKKEVFLLFPFLKRSPRATLVGDEAQKVLDRRLGKEWDTFEKESGATTYVKTRVGQMEYNVYIQLSQKVLRF